MPGYDGKMNHEDSRDPQQQYDETADADRAIIEQETQVDQDNSFRQPGQRDPVEGEMQRYEQRQEHHRKRNEAEHRLRVAAAQPCKHPQRQVSGRHDHRHPRQITGAVGEYQICETESIRRVHQRHHQAFDG